MEIPDYLEASCVRKTREDPRKQVSTTRHEAERARVFVKAPRLDRRGGDEAAKRIALQAQTHSAPSAFLRLSPSPPPPHLLDSSVLFCR